MATYTHGNFEQIATAIGKKVGQIAKHQNRFEAAANWYRVDRRRPTRIAPSKSCEKLDRIAKAARRLLTSLGVNDPDEAADGPRDPEILNALVLAGEPSEPDKPTALPVSERPSMRSANQEREALPITSDKKAALSIARRRKR
jgi:hypothetical protein